MISADEVATAIVAAAKELQVDPLAIASGAMDDTKGPRETKHNLSRARAYAGRALDRVFNSGDKINVSRPEIARMIGANAVSQGSYFSGLDGRPTPWWDDAVLSRVIEAVLKVTRPAMVAAAKAVPRAVPSETPQTPSCAKPITPKPVLRLPPDRPEPDRGAARSGMDRFSARFGRPPLDPDSDPLTRRAVERGKSYDLLAEAARNTAALQAKLPPEPDE